LKNSLWLKCMDAKSICLSFIIGLVSLVSNGQAFPVSDEMEEGYYVVVGVYDQGHATLAEAYKSGTEGAMAGFHSPKNRYYVYLSYTRDFQEALASMQNIRLTNHSEAWVFVCKPGITVPVASTDSDDTADKGKNQNIPEATIVASTQPVIPAKAPDHDKTADVANISELEGSFESETRVAFLLSNARNNSEVRGNVQIIDTERAKLTDVIGSGEVKVLEDPKNGTGNITMLCDVFGYRKQQIELNYQRLFESEYVNKLSDYYIIFFDLIRYHKGDIATMYNVYFFNDAAIMRPESRYEVNSLLEMMQENPGYKIRIHGHTNGNRAGKIITRDGDDPYYALSEKNKEGMGSARALSRERATIIKDYLISQGIAEDRMEIKAWGGKRMLYDKNGGQAKKNVRVEIEILEE
jgi:outer membrane protein OmpA-like peptidoglycan-associated protein